MLGESRMSFRLTALSVLTCLVLSGCASNVSGKIADNVPMWMGGMPNDVPPRRGTPEYEDWQKKRTEEANRVKSN
jgi:hypothetical protein